MIDLVCSAPKGRNPTAVTQDHPESHVGRALHCAVVRIVVFKRVAHEWIFKFDRQVSFARRFSWEIIAIVTSRRGSIGMFMLYPLIYARMLTHINPVNYS